MLAQASVAPSVPDCLLYLPGDAGLIGVAEAGSQKGIPRCGRRTDELTFGAMNKVRGPFQEDHPERLPRPPHLCDSAREGGITWREYLPC